MMAVILAGGRGTRLRPFTATIPKPLLPLGDVPILEIVLRQLASAGVDRVVLTLGHMAPLFVGTFGNGSRYGLRVEYCFEEEPLGTAGSLRLVEDMEDDVLVMKGDLLTTLPFRELYRTHQRQQAAGTIAVHAREVKIDYGVVCAGPEGRLQDYTEKPTIPYLVSMGINMLSRTCLEYIPTEGKFDMPELMLAMHRAGRTVACYRTDCYWQDIGRLDDYQQASDDFVANPNRFVPSRSRRECVVH
jgi:NDP-sugar pyrophosphorylase family protein